MRGLVHVLGAIALVGLVACGGGNEEPPAWKQIKKAKCETDKDCASGHICKEGRCAKGERTKEELAAAAAEKQKKQAEARKPKGPKPGEGQMRVRICPFFKNTMEAIGTIIATHQETKKKHYIHLARVTPELGFQDVFVFESLPLGTYEVDANYGIQVRGQPEVSELKCHEKVQKKACLEGKTRLIEVTADPLPPAETDKEGKALPFPCDFIAE
jgi:hypothetical protein